MAYLTAWRIVNPAALPATAVTGGTGIVVKLKSHIGQNEYQRAMIWTDGMRR